MQDSTGAKVTSQIVLDAAQFLATTSSPPGGNCHTAPKSLTNDAAGAIQAAICNLPLTGGTIDARAFGDSKYTQAQVTFDSNPFADPDVTDGTAATTEPVVVLLPARTIPVNAVIGIPRHSLLKGQGSLTTILQIGATFPGYGSNTEVTNNCGPYVSGTGGRAASR